jgi:glycosyltransferase involved in cell wall biosynthesis
MRILILAPFFPYPLTQGGKIRVFNIVKYLARRHKVFLACLNDQPVADLAPLSDLCEEVLCVPRPAAPLRDLAISLLQGIPYNGRRFVSADFRFALQSLLRRQNIDLVLCEYSLLWQYTDLFHGIPVFLDAHNIEQKIVSQIKATKTNPVMRGLYLLEERKLQTLEVRAWRECACCFTVSDQERAEIQSAVGSDKTPVVTAANGVDLERFTLKKQEGQGRNILFLGGMDYLPNLDSLRYFLQEIWPDIQRRVVDVHLDVVGRELWRIEQEQGATNVTFHEDVPEVLPWFQRADLLVVPLRLGAGTRIKILEGMASGVPIVTTSRGCEGIQVQDGEHLLVADTPADFSAQVLRILTDKDLALTLAKNGRRLVEEEYSWEKIVAGMAEKMEECDTK